MSENDGSFEPVLNRLIRSIEDLEAQVVQKKRLANELCREYGQPARYPDAETPKAANGNQKGRDVFYGRPLATVMKEFLEARGASNRGGLGAATVNEIYDALLAGGFKFESKDEANAKRGLRIGLSKNTAVFHKVGTGSGADAYGLTDWYPSARSRQQSRGSAVDSDSSQAPDAEDDDASEAA